LRYLLKCALKFIGSGLSVTYMENKRKW